MAHRSSRLVGDGGASSSAEPPWPSDLGTYGETSSDVIGAHDTVSSTMRPLYQYPGRPGASGGVSGTIPTVQDQYRYDNSLTQCHARAHYGGMHIHGQIFQNVYGRELDGHAQGQSERVDFVNALAFVFMESRVVRPTLSNTCSWLFQRENYLRWQRSSQSGSGFLWIKGKPGSGKSTLMKHALQHAKGAFDGVTVIRFFFNAYRHRLERCIKGMNLSLLYQMLQAFLHLRAGFPLHGPPHAKDKGWEVDMLGNYLD